MTRKNNDSSHIQQSLDKEELKVERERNDRTMYREQCGFLMDASLTKRKMTFVGFNDN